MGAAAPVVTVGAADPIRVDVADDPQERRRGLMGRAEVPPGTGMLFVYETPVLREFWMGNVEVPLSIAWVADGVVVGVAEMTPCPAADATCPRYAPDAPAKDTLKDMERLLKASKNWIKGASYGHR